MRMAKASQKDLDCALLIMHQLGDLERGDMPRTGHGDEDPVWPESDAEKFPHGFDEDNDEHCREALKRILAVFCKREHGGSLMRVIGGMHCVMENGVFDPAQDHLAWHPDLLPAINLRKRRECIEKALAGNPPLIDWKRRDGGTFSHAFSGYAARHYHTGAPALGWVLAYKEGGGDITHAIIPPQPGMEPVRLHRESGSAWYWVQFEQEAASHG